MIDKGLSAATIRNAFTPLRAMFRDSGEILEGGISPNPTAGLRLPKVTSRREAEEIPTPAQAARMVEHAPNRDRAIWATAAYAGLRRGELRALRWKDVDLDAGMIYVRRSWDRVERAIDPKSEAGTRDVPIMAALRPHLEVLRATGKADPDALVFATRTGGPFDPAELTRRTDKAWNAASPPVERFTLHGARHGFARICIEAGVNAKRLQIWMGHASITVTYDVYGRLLEGSDAQAVAAVDSFLTESVGQSVGQ